MSAATRTRAEVVAFAVGLMREHLDDPEERAA